MRSAAKTPTRRWAFFLPDWNVRCGPLRGRPLTPWPAAIDARCWSLQHRSGAMTPVLTLREPPRRDPWPFRQACEHPRPVSARRRPTYPWQHSEAARGGRVTRRKAAGVGSRPAHRPHAEVRLARRAGQIRRRGLDLRHGRQDHAQHHPPRAACARRRCGMAPSAGCTLLSPAIPLHAFIAHLRSPGSREPALPAHRHRTDRQESPCP